MKDRVVSEYMTLAPHTVGPHQTLKVAKDLMHNNGIRHLPVRDMGRIVGILSDRDVDFALRVDHRSPEELKVEDALTSEIFSVAPSAPLRDVAKRLANDRIGCAVVEDEGRLVGIFTTVDACRALAES